MRSPAARRVLLALILLPAASVAAQESHSPALLDHYDRAAHAAGLVPLRARTLPAGLREVRLWFSAGPGIPNTLVRVLDGPEGVRGEIVYYFPTGPIPGTEDPVRRFEDLLRPRLQDHCTGFRIVGSFGTCRRTRPAPPDWADVLDRAEEAGLWTLPDESATDRSIIVLDGWAMNVELRDGEAYRAYRWSGLGFDDTPEAVRATRVACVFNTALRATNQAPPEACSEDPAAAPPPDTVRVLAYNIHHGEGMDEVVDLERIADLIRSVDPDLVALQEVDSATTRTDGVHQAAELGRLTGLEPVFGAFMPYQGGAYGMALLSRWPIASSRNLRLPDGAEPRTALAVTVASPTTGRRVRFVGIHFYRTDDERLAQATRLEEHLAGDTVPTLLAGDFNSTPDSDVMAHLSRRWAIVTKGADHLTFPSYAPDREIDFVLFRPEGRWEVAARRLLDEPVASDHRPVVVELVLR